MRCLPHPISGAVYREVGDGLVRVEDKEKGKSGLFKWDGSFVEGDLTQADLHYLRFIGGPTLPPDKDIIWNFLPVEDPATGIQTSLPPSRGGGAEPGAQPQFVIAPYVGDPGRQTPEGMRSAAHLPQDFFLDNDPQQRALDALHAGEYLVIDGTIVYPEEEVNDWLVQAGWAPLEKLELPGCPRIIVAEAR